MLKFFNRKLWLCLMAVFAMGMSSVYSAEEVPVDEKIPNTKAKNERSNSKNPGWNQVKCATECDGAKCAANQNVAVQCAMFCKTNAWAILSCVPRAYHNFCSVKATDGSGRVIGAKKSKECAELSYGNSAILNWIYVNGPVLKSIEPFVNVWNILFSYASKKKENYRQTARIISDRLEIGDLGDNVTELKVMHKKLKNALAKVEAKLAQAENSEGSSITSSENASSYKE